MKICGGKWRCDAVVCGWCQLLLVLSYLPTMSHIDEGADWVEGPCATRKQVCPVERMKSADVVGTFGLEETQWRLSGRDGGGRILCAPLSVSRKAGDIYAVCQEIQHSSEHV